jgi:uncharacterized membrane protein YkvI
MHIGGGFATGNQTVQFFVHYGWTAVFLPIIAMFILNWVIRTIYLQSQINCCKDYREFSNAAYAPAQIILSNLYEIGTLVLYIVATATAIAGAGSLLESMVKLPYWLGIIITAALFFVLLLFGKDLVAKASAFMGVFMIVGVIILCTLALTIPGGGGDSLARNARPTNFHGNYGNAVWDMLRYVGFQSFALGSIVPYAAQLKNRQGVNKVIVLNFIMNTALIALSCFALLRWVNNFVDYSTVAAGKISNTLPILFIARQVNNPVITVIYVIVLYFAFISTGVGCCFGAVTRFETKIMTKVDVKWRRAIIAFVAIVFSYLLSRAGLTLVVKYGYGNLGWFGVIMLVVPSITVWMYRNAKKTVTKKGTALPE